MIEKITVDMKKYDKVTNNEKILYTLYNLFIILCTSMLANLFTDSISTGKL